MKEIIKEHLLGCIVLIMAAIILLPFLGCFPLTDPDETVYGLTAKEMLHANDWLSPQIYGHYWYDKPPLFYWLEMIFYSLFGVSDYTSRLPSACIGVGTVLFTYIQGKSMFNRPIAFISALVLLSAVGFMYIAKAAVTDMTLVCTLTVAMVSFFREKYYRAYAFCGLALLAKGPIGYGIPALIMLLYILCTRQWSLIRRMKIPTGILLAFVIGLPWYIMMYHVHGEVFLDTFIGFHNITRFTVPEHPGQNSLFFFIPIVLGGLLPWTGALGPAIYKLIKKRDPFKDALIFCFVWAAFIFVFFSISKTQLVTYIAPVFPPLAYIIGWFLYRSYTENKVSSVAIGTSLIIGLALLGANAIPLNPGAAFFRPAIVTASILLAASVSSPAFFLWKRHWYRALLSGVMVMFLFMTTTFTIILPSLSAYISSSPSTDTIRNAYDDHSILYIEKFLRPGITYYTGLDSIEWSEEHPIDFAVLLEDPAKAYIIMTRPTYEKTLKLQPALQQYGIAAQLTNQLILINHP